MPPSSIAAQGDPRAFFTVEHVPHMLVTYLPKSPVSTYQRASARPAQDGRQASRQARITFGPCFRSQLKVMYMTIVPSECIYRTEKLLTIAKDRGRSSRDSARYRDHACQIGKANSVL
jgi:hypothetical protein